MPTYSYDYDNASSSLSLKMDTMGRWIDTEWIPNHPDADALRTLWIAHHCLNPAVLAKFDREQVLVERAQFKSFTPISSPAAVRIFEYNYEGEPIFQAGAYLYQFSEKDSGAVIEVLVTGSFYSDDGHAVCLACLPESFIPIWIAFSQECGRLARSLEPQQKVMILGGRTASFVPTVEWEDVILPEKLKSELMEDVGAFFTKGIDVYRRLKLKPFRKLLLAGVPGTGKTMLCSALAKWALDRDYLVIYISSADRDGATFGKIQHALHIAAMSHYPALILLEELDAYLHKEEKALVLNVLDGSESSENDKGTLLIATTNYPEAIDERVLKRPGRLDRIFIIPETRREEDAEKMLRKYLGEMWQDDHRPVAEQLVGFPGAFIREVAVYALTQVAYDDLQTLPLEVLERSFTTLKDQIEARDDFLTQKARRKAGLIPQNGHNPFNKNGSD